LAFSFQPGVACIDHAVFGASSSRILCRRPDQLLCFRTHCARGGRRSAAAKLHRILLQSRAWLVIPSDSSSFGNAVFRIGIRGGNLPAGRSHLPGLPASGFLGKASLVSGFAIAGACLCGGVRDSAYAFSPLSKARREWTAVVTCSGISVP